MPTRRRAASRWRIEARSRAVAGAVLVLVGAALWGVAAILFSIAVWSALGVVIGGALVAAGVVLLVTAA